MENLKYISLCQSENFKNLLRGEKTPVFWLGLVVFAYSIYQFFNAFWEILYLSSSYHIPVWTIFSGYPDIWRNMAPPTVGGVIFLVVGLFIMEVGYKKSNRQTAVS